LYAPLHQVAHGGAPAEYAQKLIAMGGWRTPHNALGERPVDVAEKHDRKALLGVLPPEFRQRVPNGVLVEMQSHFHAAILGRCSELVDRYRLRLSELEPLLELDCPKMWFAIPGMYGGFSYRLALAGVDAKLVAESWSRVVGGSGQRHEITASGSKLVAEGFV
jgi:hypothetical protein